MVIICNNSIQRECKDNEEKGQPLAALILMRSSHSGHLGFSRSGAVWFPGAPVHVIETKQTSLSQHKRLHLETAARSTNN
jgi:hypothetical protein